MSFEIFPNFFLNFSEREMNGAEKHLYRFKSFRLDVEERQLLHHGDNIPLTPKVFDVLVALVERRGHLVEKDELLRIVWADSIVEETNVARAIHTLRKILGEDDDGRQLIETVPKCGYRFVGIIHIEEKKEDNRPTSPLPDDHAAADDARRAREAEFDSPKNSAARIRRTAIFAAVLIGPLTLVVLSALRFFDANPNRPPMFEQMKQVLLTQDGNAYAPAISSNGQYLAYMHLSGTGAAGLSIRQITTGSVLELLPPRPNINFWGLQFSPDNNYLYYVEDDGRNIGFLYRIASLGGQPQKILDFVNGGVIFSPDGTRLAFKRINKQEGRTSIIVTNEDGSDAMTIASTDLNSDYYSFDWSPDGRTILYAFKQHNPDGNIWYLAEIPAHGGAERRLGEPRKSGIYGVRWMPDQKGLILNVVDAKTKLPQIVYFSYPDGAEQRITNDLNYYYGLTLTADGKMIVSQRLMQNRQIWLVPTNNLKQMRQLTSKAQQYFETIGWLNNETLVFDAEENGNLQNYNIWRMKIDEGESRALTTGTDNNIFPAVAPDGTTVVFVSSRTGNRQIWRMKADGTQPTRLTDVKCNLSSAPRFSPDGEMVYFQCSTGGEGQLLRVSINGGEPVVVSSADISNWAISPDGKRLAYTSHDRETRKSVTRIRPVDEDRTERILDIIPDTFLQWSPDGNALDFTTKNDFTINIWRQSLSSPTARRITNFEKEKIFKFALSPDGKNLACIRYLPMFDAIMLKFD